MSADSTTRATGRIVAAQGRVCNFPRGWQALARALADLRRCSVREEDAALLPAHRGASYDPHFPVELLAGHAAGNVHGQYVHKEQLPMTLLKDGLERLRYDEFVKALQH